jgi:lysozyme family protein
MRRTLLERFMSKVSPEPNTGCWLWGGYIEPGGYGMMWVPGNRQKSAHRVSWELHKGDIPAGSFVCHSCDTRNCVNPKHLFLCNAAENAADMKAKGRSRCGERNVSVKLKAADVAEIRRLLDESSLSVGAIAERFKVSRSLVYAIRQRKVWRGRDGMEFVAQERYGKDEMTLTEVMMADFEAAFDFVMNHEDPQRSGKVTEDAGGRTRFGIAQKFHPELKPEFFSAPPEEALKQAEDILRRDYWNRMRLSEIGNQNVANKLFDMAVNMGVHQAGVYAQRAANGLITAKVALPAPLAQRSMAAVAPAKDQGAAGNASASGSAKDKADANGAGAGDDPYADLRPLVPMFRLAEDGVLGDKSLAAINSFDPIVYYQLLCDLSRQHYIHVASINPAQSANLQGWLKRAAA